MLVMLSCGPNSNKIINTVSNQIDNCDFHNYVNVDEFINQSKLRHLAFDRLVFSPKFINNEVDMSKLCDYVRQELNAVEIVMMLPVNDKSNLKGIFHNYFDSPMYTIMYVNRPTAMCIVDAIKLPIVDVKARYYSFEKNAQSRGMPEEKKSDVGGQKSDKQINVPNLENEKISKDSSQTLENSGEFIKNNQKDSYSVTGTFTGVNTANVIYNETIPVSEVTTNLDFSANSSIPLVEEKSNSEISDIFSDDLDLSVGDYGSQHTDSGFVGDDDINELENYVNTKESIGISQKNNEIPISENSVKKEVSSVLPLASEKGSIVYSNGNVKEITESSLNTSDQVKVDSVSSLIDSSRVNIITGLAGSGVTAFISKLAVKESELGKRVLIVDLDYNSNGILSFIDTNKFYKDGCNLGLSNNKVYVEDGISILSNGYNMPTSVDLSSLLNRSNLFNYDIILVDCPLECLDIIPNKVFCDCNVVIGCISDISKLVETSKVLSNRGIISLVKEVYVNKNGKIANKRIKKEDISLVKNMMLFPNGCWLDRISI